MKILFISENYPPHVEGGAEISTSLVANWLAKNNHNVFVACWRFTKKAWVDDHGVAVYPIVRKASLGSKNLFSAIRYAFGIVTAPLISSISILKLIRKIKPDVVNIVVTIYYFIPIIYFIQRFTKIRIVVDCRDYSLICPVQFKGNELKDPEHSTHGYRCLKHAYEPKNKFLLQFAHAFAHYESFIFNSYKSWLIKATKKSNRITLVANSQYVQKQLVSNGFNENNTTFIYNISQSVPLNDIVAKVPLATFTYGGRVEKEKGVWDLIEAAKLVYTKTQLPFIVNIAGSGSELLSVVEHIEKNNIDYIKVLGHLSSRDLLALYKQSLAIIAPSRWPEPFGRFIQESVSIGKPVIATRAGGITEGVEDGVTGFLFDIGDRETLAKYIEYFISHPEQSDIMGSANKKNQVKYEADIIGQKRLNVYQ